jgi:tetratricopeptide (TPR) repeat protein
MIDDGLYVLSRLAEEDPKQLQVYEALAWTYEQKKDYLKASNTREHIRTLDPFGIPNLFYLVLDYKELGENTKMQEIKNRIIQLTPNSDYAIKASQILSSIHAK